GRPVVKHQAAGVQLVVDVLGRERAEPAADEPAEGRGDVARRRPGPEPAGPGRLGGRGAAEGERGAGGGPEEGPAAGRGEHPGAAGRVAGWARRHSGAGNRSAARLYSPVEVNARSASGIGILSRVYSGAACTSHPR